MRPVGAPTSASPALSGSLVGEGRGGPLWIACVLETPCIVHRERCLRGLEMSDFQELPNPARGAEIRTPRAAPQGRHLEIPRHRSGKMPKQRCTNFERAEVLYHSQGGKGGGISCCVVRTKWLHVQMEHGSALRVLKSRFKRYGTQLGRAG